MRQIAGARGATAGELRWPSGREEREEHAWARWLADPTRSPDPAAEEATAEEEAGDPEEVAAGNASERLS